MNERTTPTSTGAGASAAPPVGSSPSGSGTKASWIHLKNETTTPRRVATATAAVEVGFLHLERCTVTVIGDNNNNNNNHYGEWIHVEHCRQRPPPPRTTTNTTTDTANTTTKATQQQQPPSLENDNINNNNKNFRQETRDDDEYNNNNNNYKNVEIDCYCDPCNFVVTMWMDNNHQHDDDEEENTTTTQFQTNPKEMEDDNNDKNDKNKFRLCMDTSSSLRFDGTMSDVFCWNHHSSSSLDHVCCSNKKKKKKTHQQQQQQQRKKRSDASLLLGLALQCQELGYIGIESIQLQFLQDDNDDNDDDKKKKIDKEEEDKNNMNSRNDMNNGNDIDDDSKEAHGENSNTCQDNKNDNNNNNNQEQQQQTTTTSLIQQATASLIITVSMPPHKQKQQPASKPLPPCMQLLFSILRSDWESLDYQHHSSYYYYQPKQKNWYNDTNHRENSKRRRRRWQQQQQQQQQQQKAPPSLRNSTFFPEELSLNEIYKRINGASLLVEQRGAEVNNSYSSGSRSLSSKEVDKDQYLDSNTSTNTNTTDNNGGDDSHVVDLGLLLLNDLPLDILVTHITSYLQAKSLDALRQTCKYLHYTLRSVVPGLYRLELYHHQINSLYWMRMRELQDLTEVDLLLSCGSTSKSRGSSSSSWRANPDGDIHRAVTGGASVLLTSPPKVLQNGNDMDNEEGDTIVQQRLSQWTGTEWRNVSQSRDDEEPPMMTRHVARGGLLCDDPGTLFI